MPGKIVFINQATGYLTIDIINEFVKSFDEVALITGSIRVQDTPLNEKVKVSKIAPYNRGNNLKKAFSWIFGTIQIHYLLKYRYPDFEVVFFTIPPTSYLLALKLRKRFSILIYDLFPEAFMANGFEKKGLVYGWWSKRNNRIFPKTHRIFTLSENMRCHVLRYSPSADVRVIPNWTAFSGFRPIPKEINRIMEREGLIGKFIVQYSGNIGVTHNVETLVEVAEILKNENLIQFLIIGRGDKSAAIGEMIEKKNLKNCRLLPFRKDEELYESLCAADIAVITLDDKTTDISVPSKTYNIFAAGVPIMSIVPSNSAVAGLIAHYDVGRSFEKQRIKEMADFILEMKNNPELNSKLAANSLNAAKDLTRENAGKYLEYYFDQGLT